MNFTLFPSSMGGEPADGSLVPSTRDPGKRRRKCQLPVCGDRWWPKLGLCLEVLR